MTLISGGKILQILFTQTSDLTGKKNYGQKEKWYFTLYYPKEVKIITQSKEVDFHALIGNIGGYLGLFLGKKFDFVVLFCSRHLTAIFTNGYRAFMHLYHFRLHTNSNSGFCIRHL